MQDIKREAQKGTAETQALCHAQWLYSLTSTLCRCNTGNTKIYEDFTVII
jgi:hypothetical protein